MELVTSPLLTSDPCCFTLHGIQRKESKPPFFQLCPKGRSTHSLKMSGSSAQDECRSVSLHQTCALNWAYMLAVVIYWAEGRAFSTGFIWTPVPQTAFCSLDGIGSFFVSHCSFLGLHFSPVSPLFLCVALEVKEKPSSDPCFHRQREYLACRVDSHGPECVLLYQQAVHLADTLQLGCL